MCLCWRLQASSSPSSQCVQKELFSHHLLCGGWEWDTLSHTHTLSHPLFLPLCLKLPKHNIKPHVQQSFSIFFGVPPSCLSPPFIHSSTLYTHNTSTTYFQTANTHTFFYSLHRTMYFTLCFFNIIFPPFLLPSILNYNFCNNFLIYFIILFFLHIFNYQSFIMSCLNIIKWVLIFVRININTFVLSINQFLR